MDSLFAGTFLYKLIKWQHPMLTQSISIALIYLFFYLYLLRGWSLVSMVSLYMIGKIVLHLFKAP